MSLIIEVENVSMQFNLYKEKIDNIKEYVIRFLKNDIHYEKFWALQDISFKVKKGEALGIVGVNGSGKSTLLKLLARVLKPTKGKISVYGSVAPLIELGAGFDMELTARENIYLNGSVLGYSRSRIKNKFDSIVEFSELDDFVDVPIKNYSSGMLSRLGFSIATMEKPDILILDEVLSVGDFKFQEKCQKRIEALIKGNTTVLFVSHNSNQVMEMCSKALWLEKGKIKMYGDAEYVCGEYQKS